MSNFNDRLKNLITQKEILIKDISFDLRIDPSLFSKVLRGVLAPPKWMPERLASYEPLQTKYKTFRAWLILDKFLEDEILEAARIIEEEKGRK